jgi:hypothetical protein
VPKATASSAHRAPTTGATYRYFLSIPATARDRGRQSPASEAADSGDKMASIQESHQVLDLISEDDRANVHAGEREVRPPPAPTTGGSN